VDTVGRSGRPATTAIVSMRRATGKPVVRHGRIEVAPLMPVSL
jgi:pyruvate/2-oxoglutarate dehydrogenase complex dihydrolipoamide acyltransferase (E2) component